MENVTWNWSPLLLIVVGTFFVVGLYVFWIYRKAWRTLHAYATSQGWQLSKKPPQESFPTDFDALPHRKFHEPAFHRVRFLYEDLQGKRIINRTECYEYGDQTSSETTFSFLISLPCDVPRGLVRFSPIAKLYEITSSSMNIPGVVGGSWECYPDERLPHAIICAEVPERFNSIIATIAYEMKQVAEICRSLEVTFEFVPGSLLISTPGVNAGKIAQLFPVVSELTARLSKLWR